VVDGKRVTLNGRGYRGRELALSRTGDRTRLVILGDSIAFGLHVSDEDTFARRLDVRDNGIEVVNLAVQGYGPDQELLVLLHDGLGYKPDAVVLAFCLANDFAEAVLPVALYDGRTPKPRFRLVGDRLVLDRSSLHQSAARRVHQWLSDYSHLFNRTLASDPRDEMPRGTQWHDRYNEALRDEDYALRLSVALVRQMDRVCRERGITFLVAVFPSRSSYRTGPRLAADFIEALLSAGIAVVDMSAHFRAHGLRFRKFTLDSIGHLSPLGHSIASTVLEDEIASQMRQQGTSTSLDARASLVAGTEPPGSSGATEGGL
jgi:hypothetical protein